MTKDLLQEFVKDSQNGQQTWETVLYGTAVLGTWLRALVETHRTVRRRLDFTVCKFLKISQAVGGIDGVQTEPNEDKGICVPEDSHHHTEREWRRKALG